MLPVYLLIFLLSGIPDSDKHLEVMQSLLAATRDFASSIKSSMDTYHSLVADLHRSYRGGR